MLDIILTSLVVVAAAAYVLWTVILPVRARTMLRAAMTGKPAPCAPDAETNGCAHRMNRHPISNGRPHSLRAMREVLKTIKGCRTPGHRNEI